jgi:hypothetical protein
MEGVMRSINRIRGVILASLGVLLGVMLAVSPREALAEALADFGDDVLTVGTKSFTIGEATGSQTFSFTLNPGEQPASDQAFNLQETDPLTGAPLFDANGVPIVSDTLVVASVFQGETQVGCQPDLVGCIPIVAPQFAQTFTFLSDLNGVGLPFVIADSNTQVEVAGGNFIHTFGSLGQVFIQSDINVPGNVPEPSTWLLLGLGVAGLAAWRWKHAV